MKRDFNNNNFRRPSRDQRNEQRREETRIETSGKVKFFNMEQGYGFITTDEGEDVFVHVTNVVTPRTYSGLSSGDRVNFAIVPSRKGVQAVDVVLNDSEDGANDPILVTGPDENEEPVETVSDEVVEYNDDPTPEETVSDDDYDAECKQPDPEPPVASEVESDDPRDLEDDPRVMKPAVSSGDDGSPVEE
jgi:CspA family cold shock protein